MMAERKEYPRPQFRRESWQNLNGKWEFAFDDNNEGKAQGWWKGDKKLDKKIIVPFSYQYPASGINDKAIHDITWYRRTFTIEKENAGKRALLCFNASDYETDVWVNGIHAINHKGGFAPFSVDITDYLNGAKNVLVVRCYDGLETAVPRGKQHWEGITYGCFYYPNSGIWQSVWLEFFGQDCIENYALKANIDTRSVKGEIHTLYGKADEAQIVLTFQGKVLQEQRIMLPQKRTRFTIDLSDNAFDFNKLLWSPESPNLISIDITVYAGGEACDKAHTRLGMRKIHIDEKGNICLNNKPLYQRLILDQGYWEESGLTPRSAEALKRDIELAKAMGFNGARKHQKVEDERFLYYADLYGYLVWAEMPSMYKNTEKSRAVFAEEWTLAVLQQKNHPCVITWVPFNESWGIEDVLFDVTVQNFVNDVYHLTKLLDDTRPVITNDGWEHTLSDVLTIHNYEQEGKTFHSWYDTLEKCCAHNWPEGRKGAFANGYGYKGQPVMITEFGGTAFVKDTVGINWGYGQGVKDDEEFLRRFEGLVTAIDDVPFMCGYCYTQVTDVQHEVNGLEDENHVPKFPKEQIKAILQKRGR